MLQGLRILAVDEDPETSMLYGAFLGSRKADARVATLGQSAIALVRPTWVPHVVVTDVRLPDMRGDDLAHTIRQRAGHPVALIRTTDDERTRRAPGQRGLGPAHCLIKPFELAELEQAIVAAVQALHA